MDSLKRPENIDTKNLASTLGQELLNYVDNSLEIQTQKLAADIARSQRYMNKTQACKYCGITNNTMDKWLSHGLQRIRIDGIIRFDKLDLDSFMDEHKLCS